MKINLLMVALALLLPLTAQAAKQVSRQEVDHLHLTKIDAISVNEIGGVISSPSALHQEMSMRADKRGAAYYMVVFSRQRGPDFTGVANLYN